MSATFPKAIYVPKSKAKARETNFGQVIGLGFNAAALIEFIKQHTNEGGWFNLDVVPRRATDDYGNTHSVQLNQWKPDMNKLRQASRPPAATANQTEQADDVPF